MVDAGDLLVPYPLRPEEREGRLKTAESILRVLTHSHIDGLTVGQSELALGPEFLRRLSADQSLPYVCANLSWPSGPGRDAVPAVFPPWRIVTLNGHRLGIFGVSSPYWKAEGVHLSDAVVAAKTAVDALSKAGVELVIALANQSAYENERLAEEVPGIDLLVEGSSRQILAFPFYMGQSLILSAGDGGKFLGRFELPFGELGKVGWKARFGQEGGGEAQLNARLLQARGAQTGSAGTAWEALYRDQVERLEREKARQGRAVEGAGAKVFEHRLEKLDAGYASAGEVLELLGRSD